jgi:hypothetical protein
MEVAKKLSALAFAVVIASAFAISLTPAHAQKHSGGSSGHGGDSAHSDSGGCGGCGGDEGGGGNGGHGQRGGHHTGDAGKGQSLKDIFHGLDAVPGTEHAGEDKHSGSSMKGGSAGRGTQGNSGSSSHEHEQ